MLKAKVVVVTGAGRGIGREIALLAAREGAQVVVNDLGGSTAGEGEDRRPADAVVAEIAAAGGTALANFASISDPAGAASIIDDAVRNFGRIDAVVNNAGILRDRIFHKMSHADWHDVVNVHLNGYFFVSRAAAEHFRQQGSGCFVHFSSSSGLIGNVGQSSYSAAKLGVVAMSKSIALDMARYGVRSNCIAPFAWSRLAQTMPEETPAQRQRVARFKSMSADKIAPLAVLLCSDAAADVNGQIFCVRKNEVFLFSHPRPIRSLHRAEGWTPQTLAEHMLPAFRPSFQNLDVSADVFAWDPV
ncbi:MAG: 3-oxoacyl-(acyl-carrier-protein) reductase [Gammaproteobacteria bacterium]|nr:3-oxoacyl-(acyl-carrier-protein) reductase [Gammaproteobacteria bacterium]